MGEETLSPPGPTTFLPLTAIELDASIQCRATIDTEVVGDYAERMTEGDQFPPIDVYGTAERCWIGDGWHRFMAAKQVGWLDVAVVLHPGGRAEALRHALGSNAHHGRRRTNADKRRAVEIALREFPTLSSRQIAELCGVSHTFADHQRPEPLATVANAPATVTTSDGRQYPAHRERPQAGPLSQEYQLEEGGVYAEPVAEPRPLLKPGPPRNGMQFARLAIMDLEQIKANDLERGQAFQVVKEWLDERC